MLRVRLLLLLGGCVLGATASWADDVGYVDCTAHPEATQVLGKAAKTQEVVGTVSCNERFTILQSGYFFTRIQTADGRVGFIYTNQISRDYAGNIAPKPAPVPPRTQVPQNAEVKTAARSSNPFSAIASAFRGNKGTPEQSLRVPAPPTPAPAAPAPSKTAEATSVAAQTNPAPLPTKQANGVRGVTISEPASTTQASASVAPPTNPAAPVQAADTSLFPAKTQVVVQNEASTSTPVEAARVQSNESAAPAGVVGVTIAEGNVATAQPQPEPPQPSAFRASDRSGYEKSYPRGGGRRFPLIELFGGFSYARLDGGAGSFTNMMGGMGSVGVNITPWLQVVADSTYNMIQQTGTKTVLYGNHYGPRLYHRGHNRWGISPFVEALAGGSRADTSITGTGGYTTSEHTFSFKVGGGVDIRPSRYLEIRLINVDYYRTSFGGSSLQQNNYAASSGVVLRLFGGHAE